MGGLAEFLRNPVGEYRKNKIRKAYNQLQLEDIRKTPRAMRTLRKAKHPLSLLACARLLEHNYPEVRSEAAEIIGLKKGYMDADRRLKDKVYERIAELLVSEDDYIRQAAVATLGELKDPYHAVSCIKIQLKHERDISVTIKMIDVLRRYMPEYDEAEKVLRWMLKNPKYETYREEIRNALGIKSQ